MNPAQWKYMDRLVCLKHFDYCNIEPDTKPLQYEQETGSMILKRWNNEI
jgi:hypothetical protein